MTDFTSDMKGMRVRSRSAAHRREYIAYFAIIFVVALPIASLTWVLSAARHWRLPEKSPFRAAWSEASIIAPIILSA
ncbi:cytochrome PufQ [Roseovarius aquimarinus]|uniref:Cytochrome PufQ n=1 Tax=Roseovarius aquimarinus TaxID=1229156 RepID=A0ABW7I301_9RHOB